MADRASELATMPYAEYLQTPEWRARAEAAKERAGWRCQVCNGPHRLDAHHRTYERRGHEDDADLIVLCGGDMGCHALFHGRGRIGARPPRPVGAVRPASSSAHARPAPATRRWPYRPPRVLRRTRRRWREAARVVRVAVILLAAGAGLLVGAANLWAK